MNKAKLKPIAALLWAPLVIPLAVTAKVTELAEYHNPKLERFLINTGSWILDRVHQGDWRKEVSPRKR